MAPRVTPPDISRGNFHIFSPELIFLDYLNVRDDFETNSGVRILVSRSDMSFQSENRNNILGWSGKPRKSEFLLCWWLLDHHRHRAPLDGRPFFFAGAGGSLLMRHGAGPGFTTNSIHTALAWRGAVVDCLAKQPTTGLFPSDFGRARRPTGRSAVAGRSSPRLGGPPTPPGLLLLTLPSCKHPLPPPPSLACFSSSLVSLRARTITNFWSRQFSRRARPPRATRRRALPPAVIDHTTAICAPAASERSSDTSTVCANRAVAAAAASPSAAGCWHCFCCCACCCCNAICCCCSGVICWYYFGT